MRPESTRPTRPTTVGAADAPREALGPELLRAFETYFAAEQANLDALREASAGRAEFVAFHAGMLESQRRSLADLAFRIATLLPEAPAAPRARPALAAIVRQNRASRARALARSVGQSVGQPRRLSGLIGGLAAAGAVLFALLGGDGGETSLTPGAAISVRQAVAATAEPLRTPSPSATRAAPTPQPGILERARIVAVYGHPYEPITGILGKFPPGEAALQAKRLAREFEEADGRPTVGALHLTVHVAQAQQTADGTYLERLGERSLQPWIDAAREHELLLIVDTQI